MYLTVERISAGYGPTPVLHDFSLQVAKGEFLAVVGPNGSGKSTLIRAITRTLRPAAGLVRLDGRDIYRMAAPTFAREVAVLAQDTVMEFEFTVEEVVLMGRLPHLVPLHGETERDWHATRLALAQTDTAHLAQRSVTALSGGERQRVLAARALAQAPRLLVLDEPTAHLDIAHQTELLDLLSHLNQEQGLTVIAVLHDLNLAAQYASRLLMLKDGSRFTDGAPAEVVTEAIVTAVYGSRVRVMPHPVEGTPHVILLSGRANVKNV